MDSQGLVHDDRANLAHHKVPFAHSIPPGMSDTTDSETKILEALAAVRPHALIGVSAQGGCFSENVLKKMAALHAQPVILALSNPTHKAECTAQEAYEHTDGAAIFASGSPFGTLGPIKLCCEHQPTYRPCQPLHPPNGQTL